jgi:folate-dependent tRNA-U54 methylase TrmFO/GidA
MSSQPAQVVGEGRAGPEAQRQVARQGAAVAVCRRRRVPQVPQEWGRQVRRQRAVAERVQEDGGAEAKAVQP